MRLIDKRAAIREQFPTLRDVQHERPGCREDRARREFYAAENRAARLRSVRSVAQREADAEADADRFIAEMKERRRVEFLNRLGRDAA